MKEVVISDNVLREAAAKGKDQFVLAFVTAITDAIGGTLTAENLLELSADQTTLLAWQMLHDEVMDGGFVQLIHNGYGPFIFQNPLAKALRQWGLHDLSKLIYEGHTLWLRHRDAIECECSDDEFMALFEQFPAFDDLDDCFVENEEAWTEQIAQYVDGHISNFAKIQK
mgnify:CR=1 FL=1